MKNLGARGRVAVLVVLSAIPALGLTVYGALEQRDIAEVHDRSDLQRYARLAAEKQTQILESSRHLLVALSGIAPVLMRDAQDCREYLRNLMLASRGFYHAMGILLANGDSYCNSTTSNERITASSRYYFRQASDSGKFSVGEYQVGRATGLQGINFGHPVLDAGGKVTGVVFAALNLNHFNEVAAETPRPPGAVVTVYDRNGVVLAQQPAFTARIGEKSPNPRVNQAMFAEKNGLFEATDVNGVPRLFAFESIGENPDGSIPLRIVVSIPKQVIYADVNKTFVKTAVGLVTVTLLLLLGAWYGAEVLVLRNLRKLLDVARKVHAGDLTARTGLPAGREEIAHLGSAIDEMAQALQDRNAQLQQALRETRELAVTDPLTGLYNRRYLWDLSGRELAKAGRTGKPVAAILMDIDHFKRFNDTWGHEAGDFVLKRVADVLREHVRGSDIACRYGGEELAVILPEATLEVAVGRAEGIRRGIAAVRLELDGKLLDAVTASFGVAVFPQHADNAEALLRAADAALYEAKRAGRDRVVVNKAVPAAA